MKRIQFIVVCLAFKIKKYFFKGAKNDISHECNQLFESLENTISPDEQKMTEEYAVTYNSTTRWQTL